MDVVNQAVAQLTGLFSSMSRGARLTAALLLVVVVVSLAYLFNHELSGGEVDLLGNEPITAAETQAAVSAFGKAGLKNYRLDGGRIRVPRGEEAVYLAAMLDHGAMPHAFGSYLEKALSPGPFSNKSQQAGLVNLAKQKELSRLIGKMENVLSAAVMIDSRDKGGLSNEKIHTASVSVEMTGSTQLNDTQVQSIRAIVCGSVAGLAPESVAVVDLKSNTPYPAGRSGIGGGGSQDQYIQTKIAHEQELLKTIREALSYIPGARIACSAELNPQIEHIEHKTQRDPKTVAKMVKETTKTTSTQGPGPNGRPGLAAQGGINQPAAVGTSGGAKSEEELSQREEINLDSGSEQQTKLAALTPLRMTASIGIPSDYIRAVWMEENRPADGAPAPVPTSVDLKQVEDRVVKDVQTKVATLLPLPKESVPNPLPLVNVSTFTSLPSEPNVDPSFGTQAISWLGTNWSSLGTGMLGLVSLVMLRSMVRSIPAGEPAPSSLAENAAAGSETSPAIAASEGGAAATGRLRRREKSGPSLREELIEIVREDPDAAANVLRSWIGNAG